MQTFLPYRDFAQSATALDNARLGKQRVEVLQLLKALTVGGGWANHPVTKMWRGYEHLLVNYGVAVCAAWTARGFRDTCLAKIAAFDREFHAQRNGDLPWWLGDDRLHTSHRSNLLRKDATWYGRFGWSEPNDLPYFWPSKETACTSSSPTSTPRPDSGSSA